ncbi:MAG: serpin family protein [Candidatus Bathyarchaeota archaeon]|nr:serpin family protein [Candidatus Bathyarchaeota archaeon]
MSTKKDYYVVVSVLVLILAISVTSYLRDKPEEELISIEFSALLDLTDDDAVEKQIIFYLVNRDSAPDVVKAVNYDTVYSEYSISVTLQNIRDIVVIENQTETSKVRFFTTSFIDYSKPDVETHLSGWIDENRHVQEWDGVSIQWINGTGNHGGPWIPDRYRQANYTTAEASNKFAFELYKQLEIGKNTLFSPYSISTAVSMVYEGARGTTSEEIQEVFHFNTDETTRLMENRAIYESLNKTENVELKTANAIWIQKEFPIEEEFVAKVKDYYHSETHQLDFYNSPEQARQTINTWVENRTNNKIKNLFPAGSIPKDVILALTNAVYFKGDWLYPFDSKYTQPKDFRVSDELNVTVDMMYLRTTPLNYTVVDGVEILELPYGNSNISMIILLPRSLAELEESLSYEDLMTWMSGLKEQGLNVYLPKFSYESKYFMKDILSEMGMPTAFSPDAADFTGINRDGNLYVDKVIHQAFIDVNEEGTEAAAATGITVRVYGGFGGGTFNVDHPFMYLIMDKQTGAILFMGRVIDPSA